MRNRPAPAAALGAAALGACMAAAWPAAAEVTLLDRDGWTVFTDGRANAFFSQGFGDAFPDPTPNPTGLQHVVVGSGQPFTAGYSSDQNTVDGRYGATRVRSGFLGTILAFGVRNQLSPTNSVKAYVQLWGTAEAYGRDRTQDFGKSTSKSFDVRQGFVAFEGPWGGVTAGRQGGLLGEISTEIDFLYGHNYGLGLPCLDIYYPTCGHIGTGALGPGNAAGVVYATPSGGGFRLRAGLYDPVRLLGGWERVPYPRPEAALTFERKLGPARLKMQLEGMYQYMAIRQAERSDRVWGFAGGARLEVGWLRLGAAAFRGKGLGAYVALQNSGSTFNQSSLDLRYFTGVYGQTALVFGPLQISFGLGRVVDDQRQADKEDATTSGLKSQLGASAAVYVSLSDNLVVGVDYFRFQTNWWGAPNSHTDSSTGNAVIDPGILTPEKQSMNFLNLGATFHW